MLRPMIMILNAPLLFKGTTIHFYFVQPKSIDHWAYRPLSLLTIKPFDHQAYQPSSPLTIKPIHLRSFFATFKPFGLLPLPLYFENFHQIKMS